ncbi:hypothetical protein MPER_12430 [Moniliophthora perniciosa FA553]|nr:hypothetical protein MPER_12430 [Moniliophthora perniciosa FA553]
MTIEEAVRLSSQLYEDSESRDERMDELHPSMSQESLQEYAGPFYEPSDSETDGDYEGQPSIYGSYLSEGHRSFLGRDPDRGSLSVHSHSEVSLGSSSDLMDHQEVSVREGSSQQSDSGVGEGQAEIVEEDPADFMDPGIWDMIVLKVSFNLSEVQRVNDPQGFIQEHGAFNRLKAEYEAARKQKEIDDARQIDENYFSKLADSGEHSEPHHFDPDHLLPVLN